MLNLEKQLTVSVEVHDFDYAQNQRPTRAVSELDASEAKEKKKGKRR